ncbi:hypothetical protein VB779_21600 [Haloarculaceae archaeon H-GB11]|nr:hypothetical protein [Haloarculaceae archaeon H-GB11]
MSLQHRFSFTSARQSLLVRLLQVVMVVVLTIGLWTANGGVIVNAAVGLLVTLLPAYFERNYRFTMDTGLVLWITVAMFLHALGTLPLSGLGYISAYNSLWWWDHMTHALSSSLVAGSAYAVVRALDEHTEALVLPDRFMFGYLLVFVMAFGVLWELLEFYISVVAVVLGSDSILVQYGLDDSVLDLVYNSIGGLLVALFGSAYLTGVVSDMAARLDQRRG